MGGVSCDDSEENEYGKAYKEAQESDCLRAVAVDSIAYYCGKEKWCG